MLIDKYDATIVKTVLELINHYIKISDTICSSRGASYVKNGACEVHRRKNA